MNGDTQFEMHLCDFKEEILKMMKQVKTISM